MVSVSSVSSVTRVVFRVTMVFFVPTFVMSCLSILTTSTSFSLFIFPIFSRIWAFSVSLWNGFSVIDGNTILWLSLTTMFISGFYVKMGFTTHSFNVVICTQFFFVSIDGGTFLIWGQVESSNIFLIYRRLSGVYIMLTNKGILIIVLLSAVRFWISYMGGIIVKGWNRGEGKFRFSLVMRGTMVKILPMVRNLIRFLLRLRWQILESRGWGHSNWEMIRQSWSWIELIHIFNYICQLHTIIYYYVARKEKVFFQYIEEAICKFKFSKQGDREDKRNVWPKSN